MLDPLLHLVYVVTGLTVFYSLMAFAIAAHRHDHARLERLTDIYTDIFQACAAAIIGALRIFRRKELSASEQSKLPPPNTS